MLRTKRIRILGIDPGYRITGYGVIDTERQRAVHVASGCIRTDATGLAERLHRICDALSAVIARYGPSEAAVEMVFMNRNADSALKLGQARGAAIVACVQAGMSVAEFTPTQIKQAIVGRGHAGKEQVQYMVKTLLCLPETPLSDAADALAVALTHGYARSRFDLHDGSTRFA